LDIRFVKDPYTRKRFFPQTHYLAVLGLREFVKDLIKENQNEYANYVSDLREIKTSGHFYFDENTLNKPANIQKGYLQAIFINEKNGIIEVMTTSYFYETNDGVMSDIKERT